MFYEYGTLGGGYGEVCCKMGRLIQILTASWFEHGIRFFGRNTKV